MGRYIKTADKNWGMELEKIRDRIEVDWNSSKNNKNDNISNNNVDKGYYITGRLDTTIYRDDCYFTGPDPDMPVKGLRKYLSASAQLFDGRCSFARLDSIEMEQFHENHVVDDDVRGQDTNDNNNNSIDNKSQNELGVITVHWTLGGVINLPWHPTIEPWSGWTKYHVDSSGLIYWHEEGWDVEVWRLFLGVVFPTVRWVDVIF